MRPKWRPQQYSSRNEKSRLHEAAAQQPRERKRNDGKRGWRQKQMMTMSRTLLLLLAVCVYNLYTTPRAPGIVYLYLEKWQMTPGGENPALSLSSGINIEEQCQEHTSSGATNWDSSFGLFPCTFDDFSICESSCLDPADDKRRRLLQRCAPKNVLIDCRARLSSSFETDEPMGTRQSIGEGLYNLSPVFSNHFNNKANLYNM